MTAKEMRDTDMLLNGQVLTGTTTTINTKKGGTLQKTRLKVLDLGPEASGGDLYWVDFLGESALGDEEMRQIARQQVQVEVRSMRASAGSKGGAFLNATGGAVRLNGQVMQKGLRAEAQANGATPGQRSA
jgi:hypothetical protein